MLRLVTPALALVVILAGCTGDTAGSTTVATGADSSTTESPDEPGIYLMLMWHQHQPFYPKDESGVYTRPWVRLHATKDYWDMAAMLEEHPDVTATFNLTPVLMLQLEDLANGAKDSYWVASEIPAHTLGIPDKTFIAERFFDVNPRIVSRFPRFQELADQRANLGVTGVVESWDADDFRDLQVLFNLAWTDPGFLEHDPLAPLVAKGRDFNEEDKEVVFAEHLRIIREVLPLHSRLWADGRIEVTTTPLAHPILPLIGDTSLATVGDPAAVLPSNRFREIADADQQVLRGLDVAEDLLGRRPVGMWPGEGSVAQLIMTLFAKNGVRWVASGEDVLAKSLGLGSFQRDASDAVLDAETLYRPYSAQIAQRDPVAMFFRDVRLSDQIGFEYSGMTADQAADDFMDRLRAIHDDIAAENTPDAGPPVVSVILDGENAWENYQNDGKDFLEALYTRLAGAGWVDTITPSEYLLLFPDQEPLEEVYPASWFQPNFATWIGEDEEAAAWDYLYETRQALRKAEQSGEVPPDDLATALTSLLFAEGSDWFWWYGADQDSGNDAYFDSAYRELLGQVFDALTQERPSFLSVPIIPERPLTADQVPADLVTIAVDGVDDGEWESAGIYRQGAVRWVFDKENLYLRYQGRVEEGLRIYIGAPQGRKTSVTYGGAVLGFGATHVVVADASGVYLCNPILDFDPGRCLQLDASQGEALAEMAIPLPELGALEAGNILLAKAGVGGSLLPDGGPMAFQVPDISDVAVFLDMADPEGDDHGMGTYLYPTDAVFAAGSYDLTRFQAGTEEDDLVLTFELGAAMGNPWGSPSGLALQTFDVYIDTDPGSATGSRLLIPGRNAALEESNGWEIAITIEGWQSALYLADADGTWEETEPTISVAVFGDQGKVVVRLPRAVLGAGAPQDWGYLAVVLSQEGFPSPGVRRVRDINPVAEQWRGGGAPDDINHTRIFDVAWEGQGEQEEYLSSYTSITTGSIDDLGPDDFATLPLIDASVD